MPKYSDFGQDVTHLFSKPLVSGGDNDKCYAGKKALVDNLTYLDTGTNLEAAHARASENLKKWNSEKETSEATKKIEVINLDWTNAARSMAKTYGVRPAVLNMANEEFFGGHYTEGALAQEETIAWTTDFHYTKPAKELINKKYYNEKDRNLINGGSGRVFCDKDRPLVCVRQGTNTYDLLQEDEFFEFYELRSAAVNKDKILKEIPQAMREKKDAEINTDMRKRIAAQLDTLIHQNIRHVVLSAFGCGMFKNDPAIISNIYKEELEKRKTYFDHIVFAIYSPGQNKINLNEFTKVLHDITLGEQPLLNDTLPAKWKEIRAELQNYVNRIQSYDSLDQDFRLKFFLTKSRLNNRNANYNLALALLKRMNNPGMTEENLNELFSKKSICEIRAAFSPTRDIHSNQLNALLEKARRINSTNLKM